VSITDVTEGFPIVAPVTLKFATSNEAGLFLPGAVPAPEPSSVALMLLGIGLVFVLRKRNSRGHQLAA
jgi:hypothetical protein